MSIDELCIVCNDSLRIQIDSDSDEEGGEAIRNTRKSQDTNEQFIYDDIELPCHHHIHYDCARDLHAQSRSDITKCPVCQHSLLTNGRILVIVRNEGGVTTDFDLGQDLEEQAILQADPELARNEAFLSFCFSGDYDALTDLLQQGADVNAIQKGTGMNGLHLCALNNDAAGITELLRRGAKRDERAFNGSTALDLAISEGSHDAAYALQ